MAKTVVSIVLVWIKTQNESEVGVGKVELSDWGSQLHQCFT